MKKDKKNKESPVWKYLVLFGVVFNIVFASGESRPKVGLALSGGGALGLAHIGVLKKIDSLNIPVDYIAGTSMGGLVGGLYACGYSAREIEKLVMNINWENLFRDVPNREYMPYFVKKELHKYQFKIDINKYQPEMPGVINGQKIELLLSRLVYNYSTINNFNELPIPFRCVSVDLISGKEIIHKKGNLARAMRATMSVPSIFAPVKMGDSLLIDGGLLNNIPVDVVQEMGADIVIASSVSNPKKSVKELTNPLKVIDQSFNIIRNKAINEQADKADLHISSVIKDYKPYNFSQETTPGIIATGHRFASQYLDQIIELKKKYNLNGIHLDELDNYHYVLGKIKITGNLSIPDSIILKKIPNIKGDIITSETIKSITNKLSATRWFKEVQYKLKRLSGNLVALQLKVIEEKAPWIHGIDIRGNKILSFTFIYRMLGIKPGDKLHLSQLERRIRYLYGLEYFKKITYDIEKVEFKHIKLILNVDEGSLTKLRFGFRYDNNYGFIANISGLQNNFIFPGLKATDEIQFIGLTRIRSKIYYPSRTFRQPFYPFVYLDFMKIPRNIYDAYASKIAEYDQQSFQIGGGAGYVFSNSTNAELNVNREYINVQPEIQLPDTVYYPSWKTDLDKLNLRFNYDQLNNTINPRSGVSIEGDLEYCDYFDILGGSPNYFKFKVKADYYYTPFNFLTINHGYYMIYSSPETPLYKGEFIGGPDSFLGIKYNQFLVKEFSYFNTAFKLHLPNKFAASFISNYALTCQHYDLYQNGAYKALSSKFGFGISLKKELPIGPIEMIFARGPTGFTDKDIQYVFYLRGGYKF